MTEPTYTFNVDVEAKQVKLIVKLPGTKKPPEVSVAGRAFILKDAKFLLELELPSSIDGENGKDMQAKFRKSKRDIAITFPLSPSYDPTKIESGDSSDSDGTTLPNDDTSSENSEEDGLRDSLASVSMISEEDKAQAEELKNEGNKFMGNPDTIAQAIVSYSQAIDLHPTAVYYSNRALAYIKKEQYGLACNDGTAAIALDPSYAKGYYRRGSANVALGKCEEALKDFKQVVKRYPKNKDALLQMKACSEMVKKMKLAEALSGGGRQSVVDLLREKKTISRMAVEAEYKGPHLPDDFESYWDTGKGKGKKGNKGGSDNAASGWQFKVTSEFIQELMKYQKDQKILHKKYTIQILCAMRDLLKSLPSLTEVAVDFSENEGCEAGEAKNRFTVCGDTHGQYYDLLHIFETNGMPGEKNQYLFNGDYVDRGSYSVEVALLLFSMKLQYPNYVHLTRGNHETKNCNVMYGFEGEVRYKYDELVMQLFTEVFNWLPLGCCINSKVIAVHGGLFSQDGVTLSNIRTCHRNCEPPPAGLMADILWSDPQPFPGRAPSKRGMSMTFGPDVTARFLEENNLQLLIRSHEVKQEGYLVEHDGKCITVFSAPNYCDQMGNKGAMIVFTDNEMIPSFVQFTHVPHPGVPPMAYAQNMSMFGL